MAGRPRSRGDDFTPSPREKQPFAPGNTAAVGNRGPRTHGAFANVAEEARQVIAMLFDADAIARHPLVALLAAETWLRCRRAEVDIAERGETLDDGTPHPLLTHLRGWHRELIDIAREFGMTPRSEASLVRERADASRLVVDLDAIRARGRAALEAREGQK
jgi:hypothetical protein